MVEALKTQMEVQKTLQEQLEVNFISLCLVLQNSLSANGTLACLIQRLVHLERLDCCLDRLLQHVYVKNL